MLTLMPCYAVTDCLMGSFVIWSILFGIKCDIKSDNQWNNKAQLPSKVGQISGLAFASRDHVITDKCAESSI